LLPAAGLIALATVVVVGARVIKVAKEHRTPMALLAQTSREESIEAKPSLKRGRSDQIRDLYAAGPSSAGEANHDLAGDHASRAEAPKAMSPPPSAVAPQRKAPSDDPEPRHRLVQRQAKRKERAAEEERGVAGGVAGGVVGGVPGGVLGGSVGQAPSARPASSGWNNEVAEQSTAAAKAKDAGDRRREAVELRRALATGVQGQERARILNRLCDALYALGERAEAASVCDAVVREFPNSPHATAALRRKALENTAAPAEKIQPSAPSQPAKGKQQSEN
jgi:hypothetical protein